MAIELLKGRRTWFLRLSGTVDVVDAGALHTAALDAVAEAPAGVVVKLEHADRLDTSATQILLALQRALEANGRSMRLEGTPARMAERWRLAGVSFERSVASGPMVVSSPPARVVPHMVTPALDSRRPPVLGSWRRTDN
jgi:anti-anti-sigma regulatory factor